MESKIIVLLSAFSVIFLLSSSSVSAATFDHIFSWFLQFLSNITGFATLDGITTVTVHLTEGWNFFSSPIAPGISVKNITDACGHNQVQYWDGGSYRFEYDMLQAGRGYVVLVFNNCSIDIHGQPFDMQPISLSAGTYYLIGSQYSAAMVADIRGTCDMSKLSVKLDQLPIDSMEPAKSYWVRSSVDCVFGTAPEVTTTTTITTTTSTTTSTTTTTIRPTTTTTSTTTTTTVPGPTISSFSCSSTGSLKAQCLIVTKRLNQSRNYFAYVAGFEKQASYPAVGATAFPGVDGSIRVVALTLKPGTYQLGAWLFEGTNPDIMQPSLAFWQGVPAEIQIS